MHRVLWVLAAAAACAGGVRAQGEPGGDEGREKVEIVGGFFDSNFSNAAKAARDIWFFYLPNTLAFVVTAGVFAVAIAAIVVAIDMIGSAVAFRNSDDTGFHYRLGIVRLVSTCVGVFLTIGAILVSLEVANVSVQSVFAITGIVGLVASQSARPVVDDVTQGIIIMYHGLVMERTIITSRNRLHNVTGYVIYVGLMRTFLLSVDDSNAIQVADHADIVRAFHLARASSMGNEPLGVRLNGRWISIIVIPNRIFGQFMFEVTGPDMGERARRIPSRHMRSSFVPGLEDIESVAEIARTSAPSPSRRRDADIHMAPFERRRK